MKINILVLLFASLLAFSCKKKEATTPKSTTPPPSTVSPNSFTLKKDGVSYTANYVLASQVDEDELWFETRMVYNEVSNNTYAGAIRRSIQPGTYLLEEGASNDFILLHVQDENTHFGWEAGSLTVLSNDTVSKVIHCTFEVLLYNDDCYGSCPQITDGEMTLHY